MQRRVFGYAPGDIPLSDISPKDMAANAVDEKRLYTPNRFSDAQITEQVKARAHFAEITGFRPYGISQLDFDVVGGRCKMPVHMVGTLKDIDPKIFWAPLFLDNRNTADTVSVLLSATNDEITSAMTSAFILGHSPQIYGLIAAGDSQYIAQQFPRTDFFTNVNHLRQKGNIKLLHKIMHAYGLRIRAIADDCIDFKNLCNPVKARIRMHDGEPEILIVDGMAYPKKTTPSKNLNQILSHPQVRSNILKTVKTRGEAQHFLMGLTRGGETSGIPADLLREMEGITRQKND